MALKFVRVALVGKHQIESDAQSVAAARELIETIGTFLREQGAEVDGR